MSQTILIKELSNDAISSTFQSSMQKDFPVEELKPLEFIMKLKERDLYLCYGLYEETTLCGYAFLCKSKEKKCLLLDYLAIFDQYRSSGFGSLFLNKLKENCSDYDGIILEVESTSLDLPNNILETRMRRISFYERNGVFKTIYSAIVREVLFDIMYLPCKKNLEELNVLEEIKVLYTSMFSKEPCWELFSLK